MKRAIQYCVQTLGGILVAILGFLGLAHFITSSGKSKMPKVQFVGRIFPEAVKLNASLPEIIWKWQEERIDLKFNIKIVGSVITADCELAAYKAEYLAELHKRVSDLVNSLIDLTVFATGHGITGILDNFINERGVKSDLLPQDLALAPLCTAYALGPAGNNDFATIAQFVCTSHALFRALHDLTDSIRIPHVGCTNCGRVIDSIRRMITPAAGNENQEWQAMQQALNIDRAYLKWISDQAKGPRHGDPAFVPGPVATEVVHRTWKVMNRYLEYLKRGSVSLTPPDFPLLQ